MSEDNLDPYENPAELLQLAARKAANRPFFMASALESYRQQEGFTSQELADFMGLNQAELGRLALCRRPDPAQIASFRQDVLKISQEFGIPPAHLANLLRQVAAFEEQAEGTVRPNFLMAARDYEDEVEVENENAGETKSNTIRRDDDADAED